MVGLDPALPVCGTDIPVQRLVWEFRKQEAVLGRGFTFSKQGYKTRAQTTVDSSWGEDEPSSSTARTARSFRPMPNFQMGIPMYICKCDGHFVECCGRSVDTVDAIDGTLHEHGQLPVMVVGITSVKPMAMYRTGACCDTV